MVIDCSVELNKPRNVPHIPPPPAVKSEPAPEEVIFMRTDEEDELENESASGCVGVSKGAKRNRGKTSDDNEAFSEE